MVMERHYRRTGKPKKEHKDESSGPSLVKDERYSIWQDGYVAGWNEAKAIVAKVNAEAGDIRVFERMILAAFILTQGQGLIGNDD